MNKYFLLGGVAVVVLVVALVAIVETVGRAPKTYAKVLANGTASDGAIYYRPYRPGSTEIRVVVPASSRKVVWLESGEYIFRSARILPNGTETESGSAVRNKVLPGVQNPTAPISDREIVYGIDVW